MTNHIRRREFITLLGGAAATWPLAARAQQRAVPLIGWLSSRTAATDALVLPPFRQALNAQGFVEGRNLTVEYRYAESQLDRLPALAADLVGRGAAVIVVVGEGHRAALAVQAASATTPIAGFLGLDPVSSFNRPGGNITGVVGFQNEVGGKRLGLVRDLLPHATTIAVLIQPGQPNTDLQMSAVQDAARLLGLQVRILNANTVGEIDAAFASLAQQRPDVLFVAVSPFFFSRLDQIITSTSRLAVPSSFFRREFVMAGGLMSYASSSAEPNRILGEYAGRILKGEKAGDLPIQRPTKFELVLNLKTAKALGLNVPTSMLLLADEVIE
jgi:putative ABC transport system substrate-binding protein